MIAEECLFFRFHRRGRERGGSSLLPFSSSRFCVSHLLVVRRGLLCGRVKTDIPANGRGSEWGCLK